MRYRYQSPWATHTRYVNVPAVIYTRTRQDMPDALVFCGMPSLHGVGVGRV